MPHQRTRPMKKKKMAKMALFGLQSEIVSSFLGSSSSMDSVAFAEPALDKKHSRGSR